MTQDTSKPYDILFLEDDQDIRHYLTLLFETEGFRCLSAQNGKVGLELLSTLPPELWPRIAFIDLMMPHLDGVGFVKALGQVEGSRNLEVFFVSASLARPAVFLNAKACGFLPKPLDSEALIEVARLRLSRISHTKASIHLSSEDNPDRP